MDESEGTRGAVDGADAAGPALISFGEGVDPVLHASVLRLLTGTTPLDDAIESRPLPTSRARRAAVQLIRAYRRSIARRLPNRCVFEPSCSRYALTAIQEHGALRGIALGALRLIRCHPWAKGGIDDVPAARDGHAITGWGGFVLRREPHDHCDHADGVQTETRVNRPNA